MDVATPELLRTLRYVRTLAEQGVHPTLAQVTVYGDAAFPRVELRNNYEEEMRQEAMWEYHYAAVSTVTEYLMRVGWIEETLRGIELTKVGWAIDAGSDGGGNVVAGVMNVVLKGNDPVSYLAFIDAIQRVRGESAVMIVDPYMPSSHLPALVRNAGVTRLLTSDVGVHDAGESREKRTAAFQLILGAQERSGLRIRYAARGAIHDRLILPDEGAGLMLGRSLGGRQMTAVVELDEVITELFRDHYRARWDNATPVEPTDLSHVGGVAP
jgi:hypothetical protein